MGTIAKDHTYQFKPKDNVNPLTDRGLIYDKNNEIRIVPTTVLTEGITGTYLLGDYNVTVENGLITEITSAL